MAPSAPAISISGLHKAYGAHSVLNDLDLRVERGSIQGLVGLNGSGKTTTLECILGLRKFDRGDVRVLELSPANLYAARGRIVAIFDTPSLNPNLTVRQCLQQAALLLDRPARDFSDVEALLGIQKYAGFRIKQLSLGNKRRASIAQALLADPELILLDEPFNGLDAGGVDDILQLIRTLNAESGTTFMLSSHQLPYLEKICSHIAILHGGNIAANGAIDELLGNKQVIRLLSPDVEAARTRLATMDGVKVLAEEDGYLSLECESMDSAELNAQLVGHNIAVAELIREKASLETLFRKITGAS
ncbi:MAG: ABC transporter ATP-binding protein [Proteobacteria bacterium]|nr:ABC transporter ATP-binding protein [Pseudomonadota bacterium]